MRAVSDQLSRLSPHGHVQAVVALSAYAAAGAFLANLTMARTVGPSARGSLAFLLQAAYFLAPVIALGADKIILRRSSNEQVPMERATRHLIVTAVLVTAMALILTGPLALALLPLAYGASWNAIRRAHALRYGSTSGFVRVAAFSTTLVIVGSVGLYLLDVRSWLVWLVPYLIVPIVLIAVALFQNLRNGIAGGIVSRESVAFVPGSLAAVAVARSDRLILPLVAGSGALGIYVVVATATEPVAWLSQAVADRRVQHLGTTDRRAYVRRLATRELPLLCALASVTGLLLFFLIEPLFGRAYAPGKGLVAPLCLAVVVFAVYRLMMGLVLAGPTAAVMSAIEGSLAVLAIPTYLGAINLMGMLGAAWGSVALYSVGAAAAYVVCSSDTATERVHCADSN